MAYGQKRTGTKKPQKYQAKPKALPIAQKALKMAKGNRSFQFADFNLTATAMSTSLTPVVRYLEPPANLGGGDRQTLQDIEMKMFIDQDVTNTTIVQYRVDLVLDRTPAKTVINLTNLYGDTTPSTTALISFDNRERYKLVKSYTGHLSNDVVESRYISFKVRSGLVLETEGTTFDQDNIQKNAYYLIMWTDATANTPKVTYDIRLVSLTT